MQNLKITSEVSEAMHSMWIAHNAHNTHRIKSSNETPDADFVHDAYEGEYLFLDLLEISQSWGPTTDLSFYALQSVFTTYLEHSNPARSVDTLNLFSTVFRLLASILEHKEFIQQQYHLYKTITDVLDNAEDGVWDKILLGKTV